MRRWHVPATALAAITLVALGACGGPSRPSLHQFTQSYDFTITPDQAPPHSREDVHYAIQILDRKTRQPIESGEGQIFAGKPIDDDAPNGPQSKTWDALAYGPEVGVYHAKLNYVVAGEWAVAIRFRRDSLRPLERTDWMQDVLPERPDSIP